MVAEAAGALTPRPGTRASPYGAPRPVPAHRWADRPALPSPRRTRRRPARTSRSPARTRDSRDGPG
ncbi:hypothetical protein JGS22_006720, partial [Streptomyces sp. P38-E01]|nr:hypothetical protein [Streptomyces tardus]